MPLRIQLVHVTWMGKKLSNIVSICHQTSCVSEMKSKSPTEAKFSHLTLAIPAIEGTSKLLMAARDSPTVKAVAVTSSFGAMLNPHKTALEQGDKIYTEKDWFSMTIEEAANRNVHFWYATAKTLAEQKGNFQSCT